MIGGPISSLRLYGLFCPCFETEEDKNARKSLQQWNTFGNQVDWHMINSSSLAKTTGFVRNLFNRQHTDTKPPIPATCKIVDSTKDTINNGLPYPELQLKPTQSSSLTDDSNNTDDENPTIGGGIGGIGNGKGVGGLLQQQQQSFQLDIPLHHIQRVDTLDPTMIVLVTKDIHSTDEKRSIKEAARISFTSTDDRDAASHDLNVLIEWNKQRQPNIEEELPAEGIKQRAIKAAHFAKRELEMRETKKTREQRKAKYIQDSGGLKYTAIAMANRAGAQ